MTCTEQKGCGLKIDSKDNRGYNLFHNLALHSNLNNFKHIFNHLIGVDKAQTIQLLTQQAFVKSKGTPIVLMLQYLDSNDSKKQFITLLQHVKSSIGAQYKKLAWTFTE